MHLHRSHKHQVQQARSVRLSWPQSSNSTVHTNETQMPMHLDMRLKHAIGDLQYQTNPNLFMLGLYKSESLLPPTQDATPCHGECMYNGDDAEKRYTRLPTCRTTSATRFGCISRTWFLADKRASLCSSKTGQLYGHRWASHKLHSYHAKRSMQVACSISTGS